ncbi:MAG: hypothetical protein LC122_03485 [Chitinophagales bacterium]|nr:hypothetical protein [Chitinophagales bacterium]
MAQTSASSKINFLDVDTTIANSDSVYYTIGEINLKGNKKTKSYIILREVPFKQGEQFTPRQLTQQLILAKNQIMNTSLFIDVVVYVSNLINNVATINIEVKERWYIFPLPYFKLADRNFNQWWNEYNKSLDRVNYGLKFFYNNASGRNDKLSLILITGYSQQVQFGYTIPFIDKKLKHGFSVNFNYSRQREINYTTENYKQVFLKDEKDFIKQNFMALLTYSYRPDSKYRFYSTLGFYNNSIADTVLKLNPNYFPTYTNSLFYISYSAILQYFGVDYIPFPKKGFMYTASFYSRGFQKDASLVQLGLKTTNAFTIDKNNFIQLHTNSTVKLGNNVAYINQPLIGYGDLFLRSMESYVIDGMACVVSNNTFYHKLFDFIFKNPIKIKNYEKIPFSFYAKLYGDLGYAHNKFADKTDKLSNSLLSSAGVGLDITTIYDFVFRIEYGVNNTGDKVFGLRINGEF